MLEKPFWGADPSPILDALRRVCQPENIVSVWFQASAPNIPTGEGGYWQRLKYILATEPVYEALGISYLSVDPPAWFHHAQGLETIGTLANLLMCPGAHGPFVDDYDTALRLAREFFDRAMGPYSRAAEAYSCQGAWCDWFLGEGILDETVLLGLGGYWWLLAVTDTD